MSVKVCHLYAAYSALYNVDVAAFAMVDCERANAVVVKIGIAARYRVDVNRTNAGGVKTEIVVQIEILVYVERANAVHPYVLQVGSSDVEVEPLICSTLDVYLVGDVESAIVNLQVEVFYRPFVALDVDIEFVALGKTSFSMPGEALGNLLNIYLKAEK